MLQSDCKKPPQQFSNLSVMYYIRTHTYSPSLTLTAIILCVSNEKAPQTLTRHIRCRVWRWDTVGAVNIRQERERGLQAFCLLRGPILGVVWGSSTVAGHEVRTIQQQLLSETRRPNPCRVGGLHLSRVWRGHEARFGGSMVGCSGFRLVLALRGPPLVEGCSSSLLIAALVLRPLAGLCMSTALFARRRPGLVQAGGCHALIHLNRNTPMRARS